MCDDNIPQLDTGKVIKTKTSNFKIVKKIGEGGFGAVYKVIDMETKNVYAMKTENAQDKVQVLKMEVCNAFNC